MNDKLAAVRTVKSEEAFLRYWLCVALRKLASQDWDYADALAAKINEDLPGEPFDTWSGIKNCAKVRP